METGDIMRTIKINTNQTIHSVTFDYKTTKLLILGDSFGQIFFHDLRKKTLLSTANFVTTK